MEVCNVEVFHPQPVPITLVLPSSLYFLFSSWIFYSSLAPTPTPTPFLSRDSMGYERTSSHYPLQLWGVHLWRLRSPTRCSRTPWVAMEISSHWGKWQFVMAGCCQACEVEQMGVCCANMVICCLTLENLIIFRINSSHVFPHYRCSALCVCFCMHCNLKAATISIFKTEQIMLKDLLLAVALLVTNQHRIITWPCSSPECFSIFPLLVCILWSTI